MTREEIKRITEDGYGDLNGTSEDMQAVCEIIATECMECFSRADEWSKLKWCAYFAFQAGRKRKLKGIKVAPIHTKRLNDQSAKGKKA